MRRALSVAVGNELCGKDSFGARVLARLRDEPELVECADLLLAHTDLLAQIERFSDYSEVVMLDAVLAPGQEGQVLLFEEQELFSWPADAPSGHQVSPLLALRLFRALHPEAQTRIRLVGLCVEAIALGPSLPPPGALDAAVELVRRAARR